MIELPSELINLSIKLNRLSGLPRVTRTVKVDVDNYVRRGTVSKFLQRLFNPSISKKVQAVERLNLLEAIEYIESQYKNIYILASATFAWSNVGEAAKLVEQYKKENNLTDSESLDKVVEHYNRNISLEFNANILTGIRDLQVKMDTALNHTHTVYASPFTNLVKQYNKPVIINGLNSDVEDTIASILNPFIAPFKRKISIQLLQRQQRNKQEERKSQQGEQKNQQEERRRQQEEQKRQHQEGTAEGPSLLGQQKYREILGVALNASPSIIRKVYIKKLKEYSNEYRKNSTHDNGERIQRLNAAYEVLSGKKEILISAVRESHNNKNERNPWEIHHNPEAPRDISQQPRCG